jgi:hypothetical protein
MRAIYRQIERPYLWLQRHFERFSPSLLLLMTATAAVFGLLALSAAIGLAADRDVLAAAFCATSSAAALWLAVRWGATARTVIWARKHFAPSAGAICSGRENGPALTTSARVLVATDDGIAEVAGRVLRRPEVLRRLSYPEVTQFRVIVDEIEVHTTANETLSWVGIPPAQCADFASVVEPQVR